MCKWDIHTVDYFIAVKILLKKNMLSAYYMPKAVLGSGIQQWASQDPALRELTLLDQHIPHGQGAKTRGGVNIGCDIWNMHLNYR